MHWVKKPVSGVRLKSLRPMTPRSKTKGTALRALSTSFTPPNMSTATVVDLTDAQMLDYAVDGDFSMHNSPAEWLAIEATMSDDNPAATDYSEPIEIDMEAGDGLGGGNHRV